MSDSEYYDVPPVRREPMSQAERRAAHADEKTHRGFELDQADRQDAHAKQEVAKQSSLRERFDLSRYEFHRQKWNALRLVALDLTERRRRERLSLQEHEIDYNGRAERYQSDRLPVPFAETHELERHRERIKKLDADANAALESTNGQGEIVSRLQTFLREQGIKIESNS